LARDIDSDGGCMLGIGGHIRRARDDTCAVDLP
jgi:hypothetical protein